MSKSQLTSTISKELQEINRDIDWKIIKGLPYKREAKRHKLLLSMLQDMGKVKREPSYSFFSFLL